MNIIQEDYVSFETAKLLKEKGFEEEPTRYYRIKDEIIVSSRFIKNTEGLRKTKDFDRKYIQSPSQSLALKWLREVHKININVLYDLQRFIKTDGTTENVDVYEVDIIAQNGTIYIGNYNYYESACEAAIRYCLKNLI